MPNNRRHLQHIRTSMLEYVQVNKADIPVSASVQQVDSVPTPSQLEGIQNPSRYVQLSGGNHWYYELTGKRPSDLAYGELAVAFRDGSERLYIKNSGGTTVEFRPWSFDRTAAYICRFDNPSLAPSGNTCTWEIPYASLKANGVSPGCASVALRETATGKQTVPDVVFDNNSQVVRIAIYSEADIAAGAYRAIITGLNYGE